MIIVDGPLALVVPLSVLPGQCVGIAGERLPSESRDHADLDLRGVKYSTVECKRTALWCPPSSEFLGESDEKPFRAADAAEPIRVFILNNFAHELRAALAEPLERLVESSTVNMTRR